MGKLKRKRGFFRSVVLEKDGEEKERARGVVGVGAGCSLCLGL